MGECNEGGKDFHIRVETAEWRALADGTLGPLWHVPLATHCSHRLP